jgi:hypothetical protein
MKRIRISQNFIKVSFGFVEPWGNKVSRKDNEGIHLENSKRLINNTASTMGGQLLF